MHDADIRASLRGDVARRHAGDPDTHIVDELGLCQGRVRVDLAVVNGALKGYEIKSLADNLRRLPQQIEVYSQVLDYAAIVLADRHREDACAMLPAWWEVVVARQLDGLVVLRVVREGTPNPSHDKRALAELLWHGEAIEMLRTRGAHRGLSGKPRAVAWDRIAETCTLDEVRGEVRTRLKARAAQRVAP